MLGTSRHSFGNIIGHAKQVDNISSLLSWSAEQFDPQLSWQDIDWVRKHWDRKLILKGVMDHDDARMAVKSGADALVVSNHGGRQLDGAPAYIYGLAADGEAGVKQALEIIRKGLDMTMALCGECDIKSLGLHNLQSTSDQRLSSGQ